MPSQGSEHFVETLHAHGGIGRNRANLIAAFLRRVPEAYVPELLLREVCYNQLFR